MTYYALSLRCHNNKAEETTRSSPVGRVLFVTASRHAPFLRSLDVHLEVDIILLMRLHTGLVSRAFYWFGADSARERERLRESIEEYYRTCKLSENA